MAELRPKGKKAKKKKGKASLKKEEDDDEETKRLHSELMLYGENE